MSEPTTVLYIGGDGRSGSTVLARVLGQTTGFFSAGEVRHLWERGVLDHRVCECGNDVRDCEIWGAAIQSIFPGHSDDEINTIARRMTAIDHDILRVRKMPSIVRARRQPHGIASLFGEYTSRLGPTYAAIAKASGARVVIDSSKLAHYAYALEASDSIALKVLHLVRDPRAQAWSWLRKKSVTDGKAGGEMDRQSIPKSGVLWSLWNHSMSSSFGDDPDRYLCVRYEDLVADPERVIPAIVRFADPTATPPKYGPDGVAVQRGHSVAGNPNRFETGSIALRGDTEWQEAMPSSAKAGVTALTLPFLRRYGYRLIP